MSKKSHILLEIAITASLAIALSYIPIQLFPGGALDLSLGLIPIAVLSIRRGVLPAFIAGACWGLLSIFVGKAFFLTVPQVLIEYPIAFAFGAFTGLFSFKIKTSPVPTGWILLASFVGVTARWSWHFIAGIIFWGSYAPKGMSPLLYSFTMNGISCLGNTIFLGILLIFLVKKAKSLLFV